MTEIVNAINDVSKKSSRVAAAMIGITEEDQLTGRELRRIFTFNHRNIDEFAEFMLNGNFGDTLEHAAERQRDRRMLATEWLNRVTLKHWAEHREGVYSNLHLGMYPSALDRWLEESRLPSNVANQIRQVYHHHSSTSVLSFIDEVEKNKLDSAALEAIYGSSNRDIFRFLATMISGEWKNQLETPQQP